MRHAAIVTLSLLAVPALCADVYRSVDPQGNVVYSDRPGDGPVERVAITARAPAAIQQRAPTRAASAAAQEPDEATIAAAESAQRAEDRAANCQTARERNQSFAQSHRLYRVDADGERSYLSDDELTKARQDAAAAVAQWCD